MLEAIRGIIALQIKYFSQGVTSSAVGVLLFDCLLVYVIFTLIPQRKPVKHEAWILVLICLFVVFVGLEIFRQPLQAMGG